MMVSETLTRLVTYDDYRHLPDDGKQYQIIGGKLFMTPAPTTLHQQIALRLKVKLFDFAQKHKLGEVLDAPVDVVLSMTDVVQPDILFVAKERRHIITKKNIVEAPDLVIEVLSEHTEAIDRDKKKQLFERHGVKEYWIVDPDARSVEIFVRAEAEKTELKAHHLFSSGDVLSSPLFSGLELPLNEIWPEKG